VHLAIATTLARSGRDTTKTLGGTRYNPVAQALSAAIEQDKDCADSG
jgi:hypothetical protein